MAFRLGPAWRSLGPAWIVVAVFAAVPVIAIVQMIAPGSMGDLSGHHVSAVGAAPRDNGEDRFAAIAMAEEAVRRVLKDPDSARFSLEVVKNAQLPIVCGAVNARNSFGGYGGASPFYVIGSVAQVAESAAGDDNRAFVSSWRLVCEGKKPPPAAAHHRRHVPREGATTPSAASAASPPPAENLAPVIVSGDPETYGKP